MFISLIVFLYTVKSYAFLDFIGDQTKKTLETAAYVDAVAELSEEISPNEELKEGAHDLRVRSERLRSEASNLKYLGRSAKSVLAGPDWSSRRLETNIKATTDYVRKLKRIIARASALGTDGATALNTTQTNIALNEIQKNQQALLIQNEDEKLREVEREQEHAQEWESFSKNQRKIRRSESKNGKLF